MRYPLPYELLFLLVILFPVYSCSSYAEIPTGGRVILTDENPGFSFTSSGSETRSGSGSVKQKSILSTADKYLFRPGGNTPESEIMRRGVDEALKGNYIEAEILFLEVKDIITDGSAENNLGVIFELTKRKKEALEMYTGALIRSPGNSHFMSNFFSFLSQNSFKAVK